VTTLGKSAHTCKVKKCKEASELNFGALNMCELNITKQNLDKTGTGMHLTAMISDREQFEI
jgi:hypothetical protein